MFGITQDRVDHYRRNYSH